MYVIQVYYILHSSNPLHLIIFIIFIALSIFPFMCAKCLFSVRFLSIHTPRYLYSSTTGMPIIFFSFFNFLPFLLCSRIPDFPLFSFILFLSIHLSIVVIALVSSSLPIPIIARSSAYAKTSKFYSFSSSISPSNIIMNSVGDKTPP